jgi:aspartate racemase
MLAQAGRSLELAGADFLVLCTNTMHKVASTIEKSVTIPLLHITDPTAAEIKRSGFTKVGLLGTRFTMEQDFYRSRLQSHYGISVLVPEKKDREIIHRVIFEELCLGKVVDASRIQFRRVIEDLVDCGAEAIILGCTEISTLVQRSDSSVPLFDTTSIHACKAAEWAMAPGEA